MHTQSFQSPINIDFLSGCRADSIQAGLTSRAMQSNGGHADLSINNLLSMMYPATPFTNIHTKLPSEAQKACEMSPRKNTDQQTAPPLAASYTSLYVKNCPPEADDLWVYERCTAFPYVLSQLALLLLSFFLTNKGYLGSRILIYIAQNSC